MVLPKLLKIGGLLGIDYCWIEGCLRDRPVLVFCLFFDVPEWGDIGLAQC